MKLNEIKSTDDAQFFSTAKEVITWLKLHGINRYTLSADLIVDVGYDLILKDSEFKHLPVRFGVVQGNFVIKDNIELVSLVGSPYLVTGNFSVTNCNYLKTLDFGPESVAKDYQISGCTSLTSLRGTPKIIKGDFSCTGNKKLKDLTGGPSEIVGDCNLVFSSFESLKGSPASVGGDFNISFNPGIKSLEGCPEKVNGDFNCKHGIGLENLKNINKYIKHIGGKFICHAPLKSHVLGLLKIAGLKEVSVSIDYLSSKSAITPPTVSKMLNKYIPEGDLFACQQELIDANLEEFAQL